MLVGMKTKNTMKTKWANMKDRLGRFARVLIIGLISALAAVTVVFVLSVVAEGLLGISLY